VGGALSPRNHSIADLTLAVTCPFGQVSLYTSLSSWHACLLDRWAWMCYNGNRRETVKKEQLLVAAVVLLIAVCPTALDAYRAWSERPETRTSIVAIYLITGIVVLAAWRMWDGGKL